MLGLVFFLQYDNIHLLIQVFRLFKFNVVFYMAGFKICHLAVCFIFVLSVYCFHFPLFLTSFEIVAYFYDYVIYIHKFQKFIYIHYRIRFIFFSSYCRDYWCATLTCYNVPSIMQLHIEEKSCTLTFAFLLASLVLLL